MSIDVRSILRELRETRRSTERRTSHEVPLVPGGRAWRRRQREKKAAIDKAMEKDHARARAQALYHAKNRERLNFARMQRARRPKEVYARAKRRALRRGAEWEFDFETWYAMWQNAPMVRDEITGFMKPAWDCKGGNYLRDTQMYRRDVDGPWSPDNCFIGLAGEELK